MNKKVQKQKFIISYDGQALKESHLINVEDLAPSLLALDKIFQISNTLLNGMNNNVHLKVSGQRSGSFEVVLYVAQYLPEVMSFIATHNPEELLNKLFGEFGILNLIKNLSKNDLKKSTINIQNLNVNGNVYNVDTVKIFNKTIKESKKFLKPLQNGIDEIKVLDEENKTLSSINKKEANTFLQYKINEDIKTNTNTFTKYYHIVTITFEEEKGKLKWKLSDNSSDNHSIITTLIEDKEFISKVEGSLLSFSKGDILKCKIREEQKEISSKLYSSYFIEKVLEHKPSLKQMNLF